MYSLMVWLSVKTLVGDKVIFLKCGLIFIVREKETRSAF